MSYKKIAFFRTSAIGDVILCTPTVLAIKEKHPSAKLYWITDSRSHSILSGLHGVEFIVFDKPRHFNDYMYIINLLREHEFDVLLAAQASLRANILYPFIKAKRKIGFDRVRSKDGHCLFVGESIRFKEEHLAESFMAFAGAIGACTTTFNWSLPLNEEDILWANTIIDNKYIKNVVIHPCASKVERGWCIYKFAELIKSLHYHQGINVILTGGSSTREVEFCGLLNFLTGNVCTNLTGNLSLKKLAALLSIADALIAPDTGPVHIANAFNTPVIGLYAVITSKLSGPWGNNFYVVDKYEEAVEKLLSVKKGKLKWGTRVHSLEAMDLITVDNVLDKVTALWGKQSHSLMLE